MKQKVRNILNKLKAEYPNAKCSLNFKTNFELLIAVMLSAQCTDERVNLVTKDLFEKYNTAKDFAEIETKELEKLIHSCGFYRNKAKNIKLASSDILEKYNGEVPTTMEELVGLAGVGRKTANVVLLEGFGVANGVAVDTHCKRVSNRTGLSHESAPEKIEQDLIKQIDKDYLERVNHLFIYHGRAICKAINPLCSKCPIEELCEKNGVDVYKKTDEKYMKIALEEAKKAAEIGEIPVGAVIVKDNKIIARAYNLKEKERDTTFHAEIEAIRIASRKLNSWRLEGCTMYVTLEPCSMCAGAIINARLDRLVIGAMDEKTGACGSKLNLLTDFKFNHKVLLKTEVLAKECEQVLKQFFNILRKSLLTIA
jgi:endonuclease-3